MIMAATGLKIGMPVVLVSAVGIGFGLLFACSLVRLLTVSSQVSAGHATDRGVSPGEESGVVLFLGTLVFAALLPWSFIGLKFQSNMALVLGMTVMLEALLSVVFVPVLIGLRKERSSP
jgi:uncharacterized membrane protein YdfJ with MMPL/SSD domain